jgi:hypothetical protein
MYPHDTHERYNRLKRKTLAALRDGRAVSVPTLAPRRLARLRWLEGTDARL